MQKKCENLEFSEIKKEYIFLHFQLFRPHFFFKPFFSKFSMIGILKVLGNDFFETEDLRAVQRSGKWKPKKKGKKNLIK